MKPKPKLMGYPPKIRRQAVEMVMDEWPGFRCTGRNLRVNHQSVANWFSDVAARTAATPIPQPPTDEDTVVEVDELFYVRRE